MARITSTQVYAVITFVAFLCQPISGLAAEADFAGWSLQIDNDALALTEDDQNYSFGFGLVVSGDIARRQWFSLDSALGQIDRQLGWSEPNDDALHSLQVGLIALTPSNLQTKRPLPGRTPYASLFFLSNAREHVRAVEQTVNYSMLSLGVVGSPVGEYTQRAIHYLTNDKQPQGWDNQISDGGEPTFRYLVARQSLQARAPIGENHFEMKRSLRGSIGYFTEASIAYSLRYGHIRSNWWQHSPENVNYLPGPDYSGKIAPTSGHPEFFVSGGAMLRLRAYNALLQGQFRDSAVEYSADELRHVIFETWMGVTREFKDGLLVSFSLRYKTREIRDTERVSSPIWGSITLSHGF